MLRSYLGILCIILSLTACRQAETPAVAEQPETQTAAPTPVDSGVVENSRFNIYATVRLSADLGGLSDRQQQMIAILIEASKIMDDLFWKQAYGDKDALLSGISDPAQRRFADINYGPWDRLAADQPFIEGAGPKPLGARFYPEDMSKEEFEAWDQEGKDGLYTLVQRKADGTLELIRYSDAYREELSRAAGLLRTAAELADNLEFANYLMMRASALETAMKVT